MPLTPAQGYQARALAALTALVLAVIFGCVWTSPPNPAPLGAPAAEFSSARARLHVEAIARAPHPIGSAEHERVRAYVMDQLRAVGLEPEVQEATVLREVYRPPVLARVENVVARKKGTAPSQLVLLVAHYDSRSMTPGASDDGYGVAALLETARALSAGPPPANDVAFLFSDGEEEGLLGATAFATQHPWAKEVGAVLNFDARGNAGPVLMYQTGEDNGSMVTELARAAPDPVASSVLAAVYRRMPNDSDLSAWLPHTPSLNFANIGGFERYHAPTDTAGRIDESTLQHHGTYALSLARALGARTLPLPRHPDASYFNLGPFFVHYNGAFDQPLTLVAALLLVAFLVIGQRHGSVRLARAAAGFGAVLAIAAAAAVACGLLGVVAGLLHVSSLRFAHAANPVGKDLYLAAFVAFSAALAFGAQRRLEALLRAAEIFAGSVAVLLLLAFLSLAYLPGAACLFAWPALVSLIVAVGLARTGALDHDDTPAVAGAIAASCPALVVIAPLIPQISDAFGVRAAPLVGALAALLAASAALAGRLLIHSAVRQVSLAAPALGAVCYLAALVYPTFGRSYPRPDTLVFAADADTGHAYWLSPDPTPDAWQAPVMVSPAEQLTGPLPYHLADEVFVAPAADTKEPGPAIAWIDNVAGDTGRRLSAKLSAPAGADLLAVQIEGAERARVAGLELPLNEGALAFVFYAPPAAGVEVALVAASHAPVVLCVVSRRAGFPVALGPRPPDLQPRPGMMAPYDRLLESDMTLVARTAHSE